MGFTHVCQQLLSEVFKTWYVPSAHEWQVVGTVTAYGNFWVMDRKHLRARSGLLGKNAVASLVTLVWPLGEKSHSRVDNYDPLLAGMLAVRNKWRGTILGRWAYSLTWIFVFFPMNNLNPQMNHFPIRDIWKIRHIWKIIHFGKWYLWLAFSYFSVLFGQ